MANLVNKNEATAMNGNVRVGYVKYCYRDWQCEWDMVRERERERVSVCVCFSVLVCESCYVWVCC